MIQDFQYKENHNGSDNSANSPLESMWKMFKEILESTTKNALPSYSTSSSSDSSKAYDQMIRSQQQIHENILNRRGLLMEQSLNEHYTHQFFDFFPAFRIKALDERDPVQFFEVVFRGRFAPRVLSLV